MRLRRFAPLVLLVLTGHLACAPEQMEERAVSSAARLVVLNGLFQNTLSSNGLFQNGLFQNGLFQNGLFQNGLFQNGLFQNGLFQNGVLQNALWQDALWQQNLAAREILRENAYARDVLQYIYECAMAPTQATVLDPGGANVTLHGRVGLAPEWTQEGGTCDESCQRWVTACLLARTNAYGVKVDISMRVPDDAPEHIKAALAVTDEESEAYTLCEGAFFGNVFQQTALPGGAVVMTPKLYACAGPGSNIPDVTKRFCSSQGAGGPIEVVGACVPRPEFPRSACLGVSGGADTGAMGDCYTSTNPTNRGTHYPEAITVYLKRPIEVCGNSVCEANEASEQTCPSDCHEGWARSFTKSLSNIVGAPEGGDWDHTLYGLRWSKTSALGPDDTVVLAGITPASVDLGGGPLGAVTGGSLAGVLAKYGPDGSHLWSKRFGFAGAMYASSVAVASDGSIAVAMAGNNAGANKKQSWLGKFTPGGDPLWSGFLGTGTHQVRALAVDHERNLIAAGEYTGAVTFGAATLSVPPTGGQRAFVLKLSPDGALQWAVDVGAGWTNTPTALAVDHGGNVLLDLFSNGTAMGLWKLSASSGAVLWTRRGWHGGATADAAGDVYATGTLAAPNEQTTAFEYDFALPPSAQGGDFFVVKYAAADGTPLHVRVVSPPCRATASGCPGEGRFEGRDVMLDGAGNVVVSAVGGNGDVIDFGAGPFLTYATPDLFVAAFSPELEPLWAKHAPMVLDSSMRGMQLDGVGRIVMSGTFAGSMRVDDRLLVSHIPEQRGVGNTFLASFAAPSTSDQMPPVVNQPHVPKPMTLEATGPDGAKVFYVAPTWLDAGNAGVTVSCSPQPNTTFPLGTTTVTCAANDPLGNETSVSFPVTVVDRLGPEFINVPAPTPVAAAGPAGAPVSFTPPQAVDLVDGAHQVTCNYASGSVFPIGTTTVECSAVDTRGNQTKATFGVTVIDPVQPTFTKVPAPFAVGAMGPAGAPVTFKPLAIDLVDGDCPVTCSPPSGSTFPLGMTTVACSATDSQGNQAQATFAVTVVDTKGPVFTQTPSLVVVEAAGPTGAPVAFTPPQAVDLVDGACPVTCSPASGSVFPLGGTTVECSASDSSGTQTEAEFGVIVADTTPPALAVPDAVAATATSSQGATVSYEVSAVDLVDGPVTPSCSSPSGSPFPLGTKVVTCSAADGRGMAVTRSFPVQVAYAWSGFLQPINADGSSIFKLGRTVPVKFRLTGASAAIADAHAVLAVAPLSPTPVGTDPEVPTTAAPDSGMTFRYHACSHEYTYNLSTKSLSEGTWELRVDLGDGVARSVQISLRR